MYDGIVNHGHFANAPEDGSGTNPGRTCLDEGQDIFFDIIVQMFRSFKEEQTCLV